MRAILRISEVKTDPLAKQTVPVSFTEVSHIVTLTSELSVIKRAGQPLFLSNIMCSKVYIKFNFFFAMSTCALLYNCHEIVLLGERRN